MITNATQKDLATALEMLNEEYDNNVIFNDISPKSKNRMNFTLRVKDSKEVGARTGFTGRRMVSACWHVHGEFFEKLFEINPEIFISAMGKKITVDDGNWEDRNIGSIYQPLYYSQACKCN